MDIAELSKGTEARVPNHHVIKEFDAQELAGSDQVARHANVGLGWLSLPAYADIGITPEGWL